jgi:hypothetical protein
MSFSIFLLRKPFSVSKNIFRIYSSFMVIAIIGIVGASIYAIAG